jgi:hypothetical protein
MWATLALATALNLAPAQSGTLQLKNARATYGVLGQERKDSKLLAGDIYYVTYDIEGLKVRDDGLVQYSMSLEVSDKDGKVQFKQDPRELDAYLALGGNSVPGFAQITIGTDQPEGEYTMKVTVKDRASNQSDTLTRKFEVMPRKFGIVQLYLTYMAPTHDTGLPAPPMAAPGQMYMLHFGLVGFDLDKARKDQPNIETVMRVLDENGKPTLGKPYGGDAKEVGPDQKRGIPMQFILQINRAGKFKIELKATDKISGKTAEQTLDLTVVEPK